MRRRHSAIAAALFTAACAEPATPWVAPPPLIEAASVARNEDNALSAIVSTQVRDADSVAVQYRVHGLVVDADSTTPKFAAGNGWVEMPVLGLLPDTEYDLRIAAYSGSQLTISEPITFTTSALPSDLPRYTASGASPTPGFIVMAAGMYGLVIDNTGRVVWYHRFLNGPWLNFEAQANGRYVARFITTDQSDIESWVEIDPLGRTTRMLACAKGLAPRFHDLLVEPSGAYWIICDETRTMNLTEYGGVANARVTGQAVQHIDATGELLFHWSPFDHFAITDADASLRTGANVNWTHANALELDRAGNVLVSFRNLNEITSIDTQTGAVRWRLGGLRNDFTLAAGTEPFEGQHSVRVLSSGELLLLDNVGDSLESRAERWVVNETLRVAQMTGSYGSTPGVRTLIGGSVQALSPARTLVSFGTEGRVEEYDAEGTVRWRIDGTPGYVFRAQRFRSLYHPGVGAGR